MNGQDTFPQEDPLFATLENWQRENPVRRRVTSADLDKEEGNFITYCGRFRRKRPAERSVNAQNQHDFQLADDKGTVFIRPTKFIKKEDIRQVCHIISYPANTLCSDEGGAIL